MESLEQLRKQLASLDELRAIVKTMKALAAASIRQYEQAVVALDGYDQSIERGLYVVLQDLEDSPKPAERRPPAAHFAAVVFGSDHGLCGRFNEEITGHALQCMNSIAKAPDRWRLLAVGARVASSLAQAGRTIEAGILTPSSAAQITVTVQQILLKIDAWRQQADVGDVYLFYNRRVDGRGYNPADTKLLPVDLQRLQLLREQHWPSRRLPTFTMGREELLSRLLHQHLFVSIFRACAESLVSEHASRLAAMHSAERNLDERLDDVTMVFRRARQGVITAELLDVMAGFEAITAGEN
ncbi:MAG: F0F1 ATP synthase subunit gamma [Pseudomonadales bacterium]|jgi:F-type H+-transporting ATPase subunit gamma|nr:F0F1 ATP synthase subunit gamma [Pseudomonadales bacterium]